ncbi:MAG: TlpA family protein disulfide reductase [Oscillospiraceae bacterium]|nr:TlpA family protein disulfide reductase [Oscillospiraceae bacterium]
MKKSLFLRFVAVVITLVMTTAMTACNHNDPAQTQDPDVTYTVTVVNRGDTPIAKCSIEIYSDASLENQIYKGIADAQGKITFTAKPSTEYVAVLSKLPAGYHVAEHYLLRGQSTTIVLSAAALTETDMDTVKYSLGDVVMDFSVTTPDGEEVTLSGLLQEKKAVVLNFWFLNCDPCKMEFPYIQQGYEQFSDDIAVLALNPYDGTAEDVANFQNTNGYTFTMAKCDSRWQKMMDIQAYPTTVIIDRFGNICLIHRGMLKDTQSFVDMVSYFVRDDYEQQFFKSAGRIPVSDK